MSKELKKKGDSFSKTAAGTDILDKRMAKRGRLLPRIPELDLKTEPNLISPMVFIGLMRAVEFVLISAVGYGLFWTYLGATASLGFASMYLVTTLVATALMTLMFQALGLYNLQAFANFVQQLPRIGFGWTIVFMTLIGLAFFLKLGAEYSRLWIAGWYLIGGGALAAFRMYSAALVRHWGHTGRLERRAVIIGGGTNGEELIQALEATPYTDIRICGVFDDRNDERISPICAGYPKLGNVDELVEFGRNTRLDMLIMTLPLTAENRLLQVLKKLWVLPVDIRLSAYTNKIKFRPRSYSYIGNVPFIDLQDKAIADWDNVVKWLFDKIMGTVLIILSAPVMALVALAVRLDSPGPVIFKQRRYGFNNELIEVYKFRSMYQEDSDQKATKLVTKDDPRVTRVGRFIRKTSLDELPQFFNVLEGSLSLVGPRPHATQAKAASALYSDVVDGYYARHRVKPGVTGWAQINGWRGETDTKEKIQHRVEHDLYYIENWSVLLDLYIVLKTPFALFNSKNAY